MLDLLTERTIVAIRGLDRVVRLVSELRRIGADSVLRLPLRRNLLVQREVGAGQLLIGSCGLH